MDRAAPLVVVSQGELDEMSRQARRDVLEACGWGIVAGAGLTLIGQWLASFLP